MATETNRCACGCGEPLDHVRPGALYATDACRSRAWKERTGYVDPRRPQPRRNARARRRRTPDLRISYRKVLDALARYLTDLGRPTPRADATALLEPLLTDKQREAIRG